MPLGGRNEPKQPHFPSILRGRPGVSFLSPWCIYLTSFVHIHIYRNVSWGGDSSRQTVTPTTERNGVATSATVIPEAERQGAPDVHVHTFLHAFWAASASRGSLSLRIRSLYLRRKRNQTMMSARVCVFVYTCVYAYAFVCDSGTALFVCACT